MKIFLDDIRDPSQCASYMHKRIGNLNPIYTEGGWLVVRSYREFVDAVCRYHPDITHVSFDHDLAADHYHELMYESSEKYYEAIKDSEEKTGYDCAVFLKDFYQGKKLPVMFVHSMNPVGTQRIIDLFKEHREG